MLEFIYLVSHRFIKMIISGATINEKNLEIRMEFPTKALFKLNRSAITKVVTATGMDKNKIKTFKSAI